METEKFPHRPQPGNFKAGKHRRVTFNLLQRRWEHRCCSLGRLRQEMGSAGAERLVDTGDLRSRTVPGQG